MIYLIGGTKGGAGKSTINMNLAAYLANQGRSVMIMDADPQASCAKWCERREDTNLNPIPLPKIHYQQNSGNVYSAALDLDKLYDIVLIDAGGVDSRELRTAMVAADHLYVPLQASQLDLETLVSLNDIVTVAMDQNPSLKVNAIVSRASSNPLVRKVSEAQELFKQFPLFNLSHNVIRDREAYRDVLPQGLGVVEYKNSKAKAEIQLLAQEMFADLDN